MPPLTPQNIAIGVLVLFFFLVGAGASRRTEEIGNRLWRFIIYAIAGLISYNVAIGQHLQPVAAIFVAVVIALAAGAVLASKRTRHIPARERRKAIARYELTGKKYNSRKHDLDHIVPFSKGGNNDADNLEVTDRHSNRSKGAKSPRWDVLGK